MHLIRTIRLRRWSEPAVFALAAALSLSLVASRPSTVRADGDDGCDASEAIACIPLPEEQPDAAGAAPRVPSAAAAAPIPPQPCPPIRYPQPAAGTAAAAPLPPPVPPGCSTRSIIATINGANVAYARALRTLDTSVLSPLWSGQALSDMIEQVRTLRAQSSYATPQLRSIWPVEIRPGGATARVRTNENWLYQQRDRFSGALIFEQDQWVENIYDLVFRGSGWTITRDVITLIAAPGDAPVPPPLPAPVASARVTTDRDFYFVGESVRGTITNDGSVTLFGGGGYACGLLEIERLVAGGWERAPNPPTLAVCTLIAQAVTPGTSKSESVPAGPTAGTYRLTFRYSSEGSGNGAAHSSPYVVQ